MPYAITGYFLKSGNVLLVRRKVFVPPPSVTVRALTFCAHSSHFGTHNGYPLRYELPRSSSLAREDKISNHKKRTQPQQSCDCVFFEIRQRVILPGAMCQVLSPRTSLTSVFCRFPQAEHLRQGSALLARNGNRWDLVAIITGMAPRFRPQ